MRAELGPLLIRDFQIPQPFDLGLQEIIARDGAITTKPTQIAEPITPSRKSNRLKYAVTKLVLGLTLAGGTGAACSHEPMLSASDNATTISSTEFGIHTPQIPSIEAANLIASDSAISRTREQVIVDCTTTTSESDHQLDPEDAHKEVLIRVGPENGALILSSSNERANSPQLRVTSSANRVVTTNRLRDPQQASVVVLEGSSAVVHPNGLQQDVPDIVCANPNNLQTAATRRITKFLTPPTDGLGYASVDVRTFAADGRVSMQPDANGIDDKNRKYTKADLP